MTRKITDDVVLERYHVPSVTSQRFSSRTVCLCTQILQKCEKVHKVNMEPYSFQVVLVQVCESAP